VPLLAVGLQPNFACKPCSIAPCISAFRFLQHKLLLLARHLAELTNDCEWFCQKKAFGRRPLVSTLLGVRHIASDRQAAFVGGFPDAPFEQKQLVMLRGSAEAYVPTVDDLISVTFAKYAT
jgi:hypothetical protein